MEIKALASSSNGNCYFISDGKTNLLIEAGININRIRKHIDLISLAGCLITHEHKDHSKSAKDIAKYCNVFSSALTLELLDFGTYNFRKKPLQEKEIYNIGTFKVIPFKTEHDAIDPFGYLIVSTITNEKLLFATDTYYIKHKFKGLNYIMIECNYSKEILDYNIDKGRILKVNSNRLIRSHFELSNVKKFLEAQDLSKVKQIYLMHLSDGNSDEKLFKREIQAITGKEVIVCKRE